MKKYTNFSFLAVLALPIIFASCGGNTSTADSEAAADTLSHPIDSAQVAINEIAEFKFHAFIANIPSPLEVIAGISKVKLDIDKNLLNSIKNASKYKTTAEIALNYGVYSVDLSYLSCFNQNEDVIKTFAATRKLALSLNAVESFDRVAAARFEKNVGNKDSLLNILDEVYTVTDEYLRNNNRLEVATFMLVGTWVESQFITLTILENYGRNTTTEYLYKKEYEMRQHINNLISLLKEYKTNEDLLQLAKDLEPLQNIYDKFKKPENVTQEEIKNLEVAVTVLRNKIIKA